MTAQRLYGILKFLEELDKKLGLQTSLEAIGTALNNLVSAPAQPLQQSALATALASFTTAAAKMGESITPSQALAIEEMGGEEFFDPSIADKVTESVQMNAMTPSVARDFVQDLAARRSAFLSTVRGAHQSLEKLGIRESELEPGSADIAFLIPRDLFQNHLGAFAKELNFISRLTQDFSEAVTGKAEQAELEQLSSSMPTVALLANAAVIAAIVTVVNKFLAAWEKIEKIRKLRSELTEIGMKGAATEELTEKITTTVDEVIGESTEVVLANYKGDGGRKSELSNALRQDAHRLFGQIERGLTVEVRVEPNSDADDESQKTLETIATLGKQMKFPQIVHEPMLLGSGEILEGEIQTAKYSKRTTTQKTTTSKKEVHKGGGRPEPNKES